MARRHRAARWGATALPDMRRTAVEQLREALDRPELAAERDMVGPRVDWQRWEDALAASLLHALGAPDRIRMDMMGHASIATTDGYTHTATEDQRAFTRALEGLLLPELEA